MRTGLLMRGEGVGVYLRNPARGFTPARHHGRAARAVPRRSLMHNKANLVAKVDIFLSARGIHV